jgi:hypothetical protein
MTDEYIISKIQLFNYMMLHSNEDLKILLIMICS